MLKLTFTDTQIYAEAVRLGLVPDGEELPRHLRSQAVASLYASRAPAEAEPEAGPAPVPPDLDAELTVYADGPVLLGRQPFPLYVAKDPIEITARPDGQTTVRLTVIVGTCHLLPGAPSA